MPDKDWLTSQLINETALGNLFADSSPLTVSIPPSSSHTFTVTLTGAIAGDPVTGSPDKTLGSTVGIYYRSVTNGVEITLRNFSTALSASLTSVVFSVAVLKEN